MDQQKSMNQLSDERFLIWTRRLSFSVPLTEDDPGDPKEAYAQAEADGRLAKAAPQDSGAEDIDIEVYPSEGSHESLPLPRTSAEYRVIELSSLISRLKHQHRASKKLHQNVNGDVSCPICDMPIRFSIDGRSWRSKGRCLTPGCLDWRE